MLPRSLACGCGGELQATALADGLPARVCPDCGGSLLALDDYRVWRQRLPPQAAPEPEPEQLSGLPAAVEDTGRARACPACSRPMARYRVAPASSFRLDRCPHCQWLWFDRGEWPALLAAGLAGALDQLLGDAWQRRIQAEEARQRREAALRQRLGSEVVDELQRIQVWLRTQPNGRELLALLSGELI